MPRVDVVKRYRTNELFWSGWSATQRFGNIPPGAKITAWAVESDELMLHKLPGEVTLE
jgi:hypothetical protein